MRWLMRYFSRKFFVELAQKIVRRCLFWQKSLQNSQNTVKYLVICCGSDGMGKSSPPRRSPWWFWWGRCADTGIAQIPVKMVEIGLFCARDWSWSFDAVLAGNWSRDQNLVEIAIGRNPLQIKICRLLLLWAVGDPVVVFFFFLGGWDGDDSALEKRCATCARTTFFCLRRNWFRLHKLTIKAITFFLCMVGLYFISLAEIISNPGLPFSLPAKSKKNDRDGGLAPPANCAKWT